MEGKGGPKWLERGEGREKKRKEEGIFGENGEGRKEKQRRRKRRRRRRRRKRRRRRRKRRRKRRRRRRAHTLMRLEDTERGGGKERP